MFFSRILTYSVLLMSIFYGVMGAKLRLLVGEGRFSVHCSSADLRGLLDYESIFCLGEHDVEFRIEFNADMQPTIVMQQIGRASFFEGKLTYSQRDCNGIPLDHLLIELMQNKKNGFFIEVGAYDGVLASNTKLMEECYGWRGILIEPSKSQFERLQVNRPGSVCFQCALGTFEENHTYGYGDFDSGPMSSFTGRLDRPATVKVLIRSLQSILDECGISHIDFFSLDTEGYELNILNGIDFNKTTFDYLLIEVYTHQYNDIVNFLDEKGYELVSCLTNYNHVSNPYWDGTHNDYLFKRRGL